MSSINCVLLNNSLDNKIGKIDYSNPIDITNNQSVSKDGLVVAESNGANNQYLGITINGNSIVSTTTGSSGGYGAVCNAFVSKSDIVKADCYGSSIKSLKLYPYKLIN